MITLPTQKSAPISTNPKFLLYFGKPKSGKTSIAAALDNALIIDLENGADFLSCQSVKASSVEDLAEIAAALKVANNASKAGYAYEYIVLDNATALEDIVLPLAMKMYRETPMGKNCTEDDVRKLPNGGGYLYLRQAFKKILNAFKGLSKQFILVAHCSDKLINKEGKELSEMSVDISGKLARMICADADAIGYVYREKNKTYMDFRGGEDAIVEARPLHLRNKKFVIAESNENNELTFNWEQIYLKNKEKC